MDNILLLLNIIAIAIIVMALVQRYPIIILDLFFCFSCILPSYFGIELSASLPLITGTRLLILLLLIYVFLKRKRTNIVSVLKNEKVLIILVVYFSFRIIAEVYFLPSLAGYAIKELFSIIFEQLLVMVLIIEVITDMRIFFRCIHSLIMGATLIFCVGIIQTFTGINLAYYLNTVHRTMLQTNGLRLGLSRAEASFGHPVYFAEFCVLLIPLISYAFDVSKKKRYLFILALDIIALFLSNSRGALLPGVMIFIFLLISKKKSVKKKYNYFLVVSLFVMILIIFIVPSVGTLVDTVVKSILNIFGAGFDLGSDYGGNSEGLDSRASQISGIWWVVTNGALLFGLGPEAHMRGLVSYFFNNRWNNLRTIDVGYVGFFICEGLIGSIGQLALIFGMIYQSIKRRNRNEVMNANNSFCYCFIAYALLLLSATGLNIIYWVIIGLFLAYNNLKQKM